MLSGQTENMQESVSPEGREAESQYIYLELCFQKNLDRSDFNFSISGYLYFVLRRTVFMTICGVGAAL